MTSPHIYAHYASRCNSIDEDVYRSGRMVRFIASKKHECEKLLSYVMFVGMAIRPEHCALPVKPSVSL